MHAFLLVTVWADYFGILRGGGIELRERFPVVGTWLRENESYIDLQNYI